VDRQLQNLIRTDFERLQRRERLATDANVQKLIFLQAVEGHAHNGHGEFRQRRFVDVTIADVVRALGWDPREIKRARQELIDEIFDWVKRACAGDDARTLTNRDGRPLLAVPFLGQLQVDAKAVLHGIYLGGLRDDPAFRAIVEKEKGITIGGGSCYIVDTTVMRQLGLDGEKLAHRAHAAKITEYRRQGLLVDLPPEKVDDDRYRYMYIRAREGPGHSDDAAVVFAGLRWGRDCALGVFLADAIDTLEKYSEKYHDQDDELSRYVAAWEGFEAGWNDDAKALTFLATEETEHEDDVPDSSLRYFLRIDADANVCALQNHLAFIDGRATATMLVGFDRILSDKFYRWAHARLRQYEGVAARAPKPGTAAALTERDFVIARADDRVEDVAAAMAAAGAEVAFVLDDRGAIVGTVRAAQLLRTLWPGRQL